MSIETANQDLIEMQLDEFSVRFLPLLDVIHSLVKNSESSLILALEGRCGSGKSTLSTILKEKFDCNVIQMDDFFLPPKFRTAERLNEPGGNIHYERFIEEIVNPLKKGLPISYNAFQCSTNSYSNVDLQPSKLTIIEGVYSLHPKLQSIYDYKVFLKMSSEEQIRRLSIRNENKLEMFIDTWIPLEEKYYSTFQVEACCDLVFNTETMTGILNSDAHIF
ncbi:MAG TPA: hypothetical protein VNR38_15970 [Ureibacillus sp.]|nr:hypothetical protein [Ureibacillus sp.]